MENANAKLLEHIIEIKHTLGGLEAKIDLIDQKIERHLDDDAAALRTIDSRLANLETKTAEDGATLENFGPTLVQHDKRISKMETRQSWIMGVGATITFLISSAIFFIKGGK